MLGDLLDIQRISV